MNEPIIGYMDKIDFDCELGMAPGGNTVFPSIEDLKRHHGSCLDSCGIVKVEVKLVEVVQLTDLSTEYLHDLKDGVGECTSEKIFNGCGDK